MLEINMDDVIAVVQSVAPQLIVIVVALLAAIVATVAVNRQTMASEKGRKLTHSLAWVAAAVVTVASVNSMLMGPTSWPWTSSPRASRCCRTRTTCCRSSWAT